MSRSEREMAENEKAMEDLMEHLKKLEEQAAEIMKECQQAEVRWALVAPSSGRSLTVTNEGN